MEENKSAFKWIPLSSSLNLAPAAGMRGSNLPAQLSDLPPQHLDNNFPNQHTREGLSPFSSFMCIGFRPH